MIPSFSACTFPWFSFMVRGDSENVRLLSLVVFQIFMFIQTLDQKIFRQIWWPQSFEVMWPFYRFGWSGDWSILSSILFSSPSLLCHIMAGPSWPCGGRTAWRSQQTGGLAFRPRWSRQTSRRSSPWETGCTSGWLVWRRMFRQCEWESRPLKMSFFMPLFYLLCSESAHWFANFQLSFWKFEVKQNMLKEIKYKGKKWFFCVLSSCFIVTHLHTRSLN